MCQSHTSYQSLKVWPFFIVFAAQILSRQHMCETMCETLAEWSWRYSLAAVFTYRLKWIWSSGNDWLWNYINTYPNMNVDDHTKKTSKCFPIRSPGWTRRSAFCSKHATRHLGLEIGGLQWSPMIAYLFMLPTALLSLQMIIVVRLNSPGSTCRGNY